MFKHLVLLVMILISSCCKEEVDECPCVEEQQYPIYKGCSPGTIYDLNADCKSTEEMFRQLFSVLKYPEEARIDSVEGRVTIAFDIYVDGSIGNFTVVNDTLGHGLADAAIEALMTLNEKGFCPAREDCVPVLFNFTFPVLFTL